MDLIHKLILLHCGTVHAHLHLGCWWTFEVRSTKYLSEQEEKLFAWDQSHIKHWIWSHLYTWIWAYGVTINAVITVLYISIWRQWKDLFLLLFYITWSSVFQLDRNEMANDLNWTTEILVIYESNMGIQIISDTNLLKIRNTLFQRQISSLEKLNLIFFRIVCKVWTRPKEHWNALNLILKVAFKSVFPECRYIYYWSSLSRHSHQDERSRWLNLGPSIGMLVVDETCY